MDFFNEDVAVGTVPADGARNLLGQGTLLFAFAFSRVVRGGLGEHSGFSFLGVALLLAVLLLVLTRADDLEGVLGDHRVGFGRGELGLGDGFISLCPAGPLCGKRVVLGVLQLVCSRAGERMEFYCFHSG